MVEPQNRRLPDSLMLQIIEGQKKQTESIVRLEEKADQRQRQTADLYDKIENLVISVTELKSTAHQTSLNVSNLDDALRRHMDGEAESIQMAIAGGVAAAVDLAGLGPIKTTDGTIRTAADDLEGMRRGWHWIVEVGASMRKSIVKWVAGVLFVAATVATAKLSGVQITGIPFLSP